MPRVIIAQQGSSPYLGTSSIMGKVVGVCIIAIIVVFIVKKLRGKK